MDLLFPSSAPRLPAVVGGNSTETWLIPTKPRDSPVVECNSCGWPTDELEPVHRVYLAPSDAPDGATDTVLDELEWWCVSCRSHYPHQGALT